MRRRWPPKTSISHEASNPAVQTLALIDELRAPAVPLPLPPRLPKPTFWPLLMRTNWSLLEIEGSSLAPSIRRADRLSARRAVARCRFRLPAAARVTSRSSSGSRSVVHHWAGGSASAVTVLGRVLGTALA